MFKPEPWRWTHWPLGSRLRVAATLLVFFPAPTRAWFVSTCFHFPPYHYGTIYSAACCSISYAFIVKHIPQTARVQSGINGHVFYFPPICLPVDFQCLRNKYIFPATGKIFLASF
jgi:hypothetical protein